MTRSNIKISLIVLAIAVVLIFGIFAIMINSGSSDTEARNSSTSQAKNVRPPSEITDTHDFYVYFINTGRSDSILIGIDGKHYLIDTGEDTSVNAIENALELNGVTKLDGVFITHTHKDHIGGLPEISEKYEIDALYTAEITELTKKGKNKLDELASKTGLSDVHTKLNKGDTVEISDNIFFEVLGPIELNTDDDNDNSLVLKLTVNGRTLLFVGDMQFAEEKSLLNAGTNLTADILKVGNHGNPDATSAEFARAVSPALSFITTDTSTDTDSANSRVKKALAGSKIYVTENYKSGIRLTITESGEMIVSDN